MAIIVPVALDEMKAETFAAPVATLLNSLTPTAWVGFPFTAAASNLGNNQPLQYRRAGDIVQLRGTFQVTAALAANQELAFGTLPTGFRPPIALIQIALGGWIAEGLMRININSTGQVSVKPSINLDAAGGNFVSVGGMIQFATT